MKHSRKKLQRFFLRAAGIAGVFMPLVFFLDNRNPTAESGDPIHVAKAFYRATYARDFSAAYTHLSAADRRVKDKAGYLYDQASFAGFALELMKRFAAGLEFEVIRREMTGERALDGRLQSSCRR